MGRAHICALALSVSRLSPLQYSYPLLYFTTNFCESTFLMSLHAANTVGLFCLLRLINYSRLGSQAASRQHLKVVNSFPPFALCASRFSRQRTSLSVSSLHPLGGGWSTHSRGSHLGLTCHDTSTLCGTWSGTVMLFKLISLKSLLVFELFLCILVTLEDLIVLDFTELQSFVHLAFEFLS